MSRNHKLDEALKTARKKNVIESAFYLFADRGIDSVSMPKIADDSGVGKPSLYRYFENKTDLAITVGEWKWREYISQRSNSITKDQIDQMTAVEYMRWYLDSFIDLYKNQPELLRFNYHFHAFLRKEKITNEQKQQQLLIIEDLCAAFHNLYEKGRKDGTLQMEIEEPIMFSSSFHIMLAASTRYAIGLAYPGTDPERELLMLEEMLIEKFYNSSSYL